MFDEFDLALGELYLHQLVNFDTWSRVINNVRKSSTLDHIYCKDPTLIEGLTQISPIFGDHVIVLFNLRSITAVKETSMRRDWSRYSKDLELSKVNWSTDFDCV